MSLVLNLRLIDRQETDVTVLEVYEGPDKRRVRFFVHAGGPAYSEVWTGTAWQLVHQLLGKCTLLQASLVRLYRPTEDILGWSPHG